MSNPLVSVIIPVYNVDKYLDDCLNSVLGQTYKNVEIIAINDGSTDQSLNILEDYASRHKNMRIISQSNLGQSVARNTGINNSNGKYIYFLDSDDYILPKTLEHLIDKMEKYQLDIIRFSGESFFDDVEVPIKLREYEFSRYFDLDKVYEKEEIIIKCFQTFTPSPVLYVLRKELIFKNNIFFKPGIIHEDELFSLKVFLSSNKMMYHSESLYMRRYRPMSTMTDKSLKSRKKSFDSRCVLYNEFTNLLSRYSDFYEIKLIKKRMRSIMTSLIFDYNDLERSYRIRKIRNLENLSVSQLAYCVLRKKLIR